MAVPVVESVTTQGSTGEASTLNFTKPTGLAEGELLIVVAGNDDLTATAQFDGTTNNVRNQSDGSDAGFTFINEAGNDTCQAHVAAWYKKMTASDISSGAWRVDAQSSDDMNVIAIRVSGQHATSPLDSTGADEINTSNTTIDMTSTVTTTVNDCLAFAVFSQDGGDTSPFAWQSGTGWAETAESTGSVTTGSGNAIGVYQKDQSTAGDVGALGVTQQVADGGASFMFAIAPAAVTGSPWYYYAQLED